MEKGRHRLIACLTAVALAALLFLIYSFLPFTAPGHHSSPDESANRFFSELFADHQVLHYWDSANLLSPGNAFPRSMRIVDDFTVPVGFIGLPVLFGGIGMALGKAAIPFVTPALAVLGVLGWFLLVRSFFGRQVGLAAAALLAVHPIWWYESARTMQPNAAFVVLVIWSAYFWLAGPFRRLSDRRLAPMTDSLVGGLLLGLALAVRTAEVYWIAIAAVVLILVNLRRLSWWQVGVGSAAAALTLLPFLFMNRNLYGSAWRSGYGVVSSVGAEAAAGGLGMRLIGPLQPYLFPLGFAPRTAAQHFWVYGINFLPWWSFAVLLSIGWLAWPLRRRRLELTDAAKQWSAVAVAVCAWLILFYGSWVVRDNPDPNAVTIGSSYFRYWLPIAVLSTLPVAAAVVHLLRRLPWPRTIVGLFALYLIASSYVVFLSPGEGLLHVQREIRRYTGIVEDLDRTLPKTAVVVVDQADKYAFPIRSVVQPFRSDHAWQAIRDYVGRVPVYYFGITLPAEDYVWLRDSRLAPLGIIVETMRQYDHETLYRFKPLRDESDERSQR